MLTWSIIREKKLEDIIRNKSKEAASKKTGTFSEPVLFQREIEESDDEIEFA